MFYSFLIVFLGTVGISLHLSHSHAASTDVGVEHGVVVLHGDGTLQVVERIFHLVVAHAGNTHIGKSHEVVGIFVEHTLEEILCFVGLAKIRIGVVDILQDHLVLRVLLMKLKQVVDVVDRVLSGLQSVLQDEHAQAQRIVALLGILHGYLAIARSTLHILALIGIDSSEASHLTHEAGLLCAVDIGEERVDVAVDECSPVLQYLSGTLFLCGSILSGIHQGKASTKHTVHILGKLRLDLSLCVGQLVVFVAFHSTHHGVVGSFVHTLLVVGIVLLHGLVELFDATLFVELVESEVNKLVVGSGFLVVAQALKVRVQEAESFLIVLHTLDLLSYSRVLSTG